MSTNVAEVIFLSEINSENYTLYADKRVRITGSLSFLAAMHRYCQLVHKESSMHIDLTFVDMSGMKIDDLYQVIGDIKLYDPSRKTFDGCQDRIYLEAYNIRCVNGMDVNLFEQAIFARRRFLQDIDP